MYTAVKNALRSHTKRMRTMNKYASCYECQLKHGRCTHPDNKCDESCETLVCNRKEIVK